MRKSLIGSGILLVIVVGFVATLSLIMQPKVEATPITWTAQKIEATALEYAQQMALQGTPTSTVSKKMPVAEFRLRLDPFSKGDLGTDEVWLVVFKGKVIVRHPSQQTIASETTADTMWVNLTPNGRVIGWGTLAPGTVLDLNSPPFTSSTSIVSLPASQITPTAKAPVT